MKHEIYIAALKKTQAAPANYCNIPWTIFIGNFPNSEFSKYKNLHDHLNDLK